MKPQGVNDMAKKKSKKKKQPLQEIYGDDSNDDVEVTDKEVGNALTEIITELKAKYGDEWTKYIGKEFVD